MANRLFYVLLAVSLFYAPSLTATEKIDTLEQIRESGKIRIGFRERQPPMSFVDNDGKPAGFSIDLCAHIVNGVEDTLGKDNIAVEFIPVSSSNRFDALQNNTIDILCGATTKTVARGKLVDFTQLTYATGASLLSREGSGVEGISGLQGKKVAVAKGTTTLDTLSTKLQDAASNAIIVTVDSASAGMEALLKGEVDAISADQVVLIGLVLMHKGDEKFTIAGEIFSYEPFALAVRRNDSSFRWLADSVLARLNRSGQIRSIYSKWIGEFTQDMPPLLEAMYLLNSTPE